MNLLGPKYSDTQRCRTGRSIRQWRDQFRRIVCDDHVEIFSAQASESGRGPDGLSFPARLAGARPASILESRNEN